ncbi:MAG TPA: riboflavin synthase [Elusimicrobia bacterium]|jgi:riboflavin synthase|nr:riboflavin synthase [Elusimicrobiota bacterium]
MFTGIIEDLGIVKKITNTELSVSTKLNNIKIGESIAVNGVCLTVTSYRSQVISFDLSEETLKKTNLGELKPRDEVNLERAIKVGERLGGHFLTGHIEGVGKILSIKAENETKIFEFSISEEIAKYLVSKGSIAVDGISLTIVSVNQSPITNYQSPTFTVAVIPYTLENTTLGFKKVSDSVNLEPDILAKYMESFIQTKKTKKEITLDFLKKTGYL